MRLRTGTEGSKDEQEAILHWERNMQRLMMTQTGLWVKKDIEGKKK